MVIKKPLYEVLPYCYILIGFTAVVLLDSPLGYASGALLYIAGAAIWVFRSQYRRKNGQAEIANRRGRVVFPEWLYECLPFAYIAIGVVALVVIESIIGDLAGMVFMLAGVLVWLIRAIYRSHPPFEDEGAASNAKDEKPMGV